MAKVAVRPITYFGVRLSDNVVETPEGYLIFKNAVIARTGFQEYKGKELPEDELDEQGIEIAPEDVVNVYRSPEEVFSAKTIASFEGKPVTDEHPGELLDIDSIEDYQCGHIQNVRAGKEPLDTGDYPLLADIFVTSKALIEKWRSGIRELSCGYNYHIIKSGNNILQVDMTGNHVAFVPNGRAGNHVRVNDSKPKMENISMETQHETAFGEGIKVIAEKSTAQQLGAFLRSVLGMSGKPAVAMDCDSAMEKEANDAKAKDAEYRKRMHDALDKHLNAKDAAKEEQQAMEDADMEELTGLLAGGAGALKSKSTEGLDSEEEQEEEAEEVEEEEKDGGAADSEEDEEEEGAAEDEAVQSEAAPVIPEYARTKPGVPSAVDAAYAAGAKAGASSVLKSLKPFVARSKNKALTGAFDTASKVVKETGWKGSASYGKVARAAGVGRDAAAHEPFNIEEKRAQLATDAYAEARKSMSKR